MKLLLPDEQSPVADQLWRAASRRTASCLLYTEARAALAAATRAGRLKPAQLRLAVSDLDAQADALTTIGVSTQLARIAADIAETQALRGYDAVHLTTALAAGCRVMVTWDQQLAAAARACGIPSAPPEPSPDS